MGPYCMVWTVDSVGAAILANLFWSHIDNIATVPISLPACF